MRQLIPTWLDNLAMTVVTIIQLLTIVIGGLVITVIWLLSYGQISLFVHPGSVHSRGYWILAINTMAICIAAQCYWGAVLVLGLSLCILDAAIFVREMRPALTLDGRNEKANSENRRPAS